MKNMSFFTQKDLTASQKTEILHEKMTKKCQKRYQKEHPPPQKPEVLPEKLKNVLPMGILKKKFSTPNFTKFLNPYANFSALFYLYSKLS